MGDPLEEAGWWDLLVVGGGTAGIVGAKTAAGLGARVLLVERARTGGDCLWTGCVPSKSLLAAAAAAARARSSEELGVYAGGVTVDFARAMKHVHAAVAALAPADSPQALEAAGVRVASGVACFTGPQRAEVDGRPVAFDQALVCTGADPAVPPIPGLPESAHLTSESVWDLEADPGRLVVLGGGNVGCELGQAFARLGAEVGVVEAADRLLPGEDAHASRVVAAALARDGVHVRTGSALAEVHPDGHGGELVLADGTRMGYDRLLVALGRTPRSRGLGLGAAGVRVDDRGFVAVDATLRTSNPRIRAAGDVTPHPQFTHTAGVNASLAASNAVLGLRRRVDTATVPRVTYTHPEVAAVGVDVATAERDPGLTVTRLFHADLDRAVAESESEGHTALVLDRRGRILGAGVVGPRAGETLGELSLAVRHGMRTSSLAGTTHAYPTYNDGPWNLAVADVRARLARPATARALGVLAGVRRRWVHAGARRAQARSR